MADMLIVNPELPSGTETERDPKWQVAQVKYPDGSYKEFDVDGGSEGSDLFRQVTAGMQLNERKYFSLFFYDPADGSRWMLKSDSKVEHQLRNPDWERTEKERNRQLREVRRRAPLAPIQPLPWNFTLEVMFYPDVPSSLTDILAKHFLFLQLQKDVLTGRLPTDMVTYARLGALLVQLKFGDAPCTMSEEYKELMVHSKLDPYSIHEGEVVEKILEQHKELKGLTTTEAVNKFMDTCASLPLYGFAFYKAKDANKQEVDIGVGTRGMKICKNGTVLMDFPFGIYGACWNENKFKIFNDKDRNEEHIFEHSRSILDFYYSNCYYAKDAYGIWFG